MADTYDVIICGSGSGGGFLVGEIAPYASVLLLEAGPYAGGDVKPGFGSPERRRLSTQFNLGSFIPDSVNSNSGSLMHAYPIYLDESNPSSAAVQREARVVGGGSFVNVGAWVRPRLVDWDGFVEATNVQGWTKADFEPHFRKAETISYVHRDRRENWNKASVLYEQVALSMGIPVFETASNRFHCIFCGFRNNAGMPCKYDSLMGTAMTQIPKALKSGTVLVDNATVVKIEISNGTATGVTYRRNGETITANARKLVVASAGAIGSPLLLFNSNVHRLNANVGKYLRAHPGISMDCLLPGEDWNSDRGFQWNINHFVMDEKGELMDALVHGSAGFATATPWISAQVGFFGKPFKDLMRKYRSRAGVFIFTLKPNVYGRVVGSVEEPVIIYPVGDLSGFLEPKLMTDLLAGVRQVGEVFRRMGAIAQFPTPDQPDAVLRGTLTQLVTTAGALHPQGTCRAGSSPANSVVDTNCMSWDVKNLMVCDASVIPNHISSNPNAMIMAVASRCSDYVIKEILGQSLPANTVPVAESEAIA